MQAARVKANVKFWRMYKTNGFESPHGRYRCGTDIKLSTKGADMAWET